MFNPEEIIFCPTAECNLHCPHCFVSQSKITLDTQKSISFLVSAATNIQKVGFSGGEPFLNLDFMLALIKKTVQLDLLFDQIMTNGTWWKNPEELHSTLQKIQEAGYDGKIGLSWDIFHNQNPQKIEYFIETVQQYFGKESINIQSVKHHEGGSLPPSRHFVASIPLSSGCTKNNSAAPATPPENKSAQKTFYKSAKKWESMFKTFTKNHPEIPVYKLPQTFLSEDKRAWQNFFWFKEDYCEGPGQILYIHANGKIAPCCGFANENEKLFIGTIDDNFQTVMKNAEKNKMVKLCYETGLSNYRKEIQKKIHDQGKKFPGKCRDICSFCDFICKNF